MTIKKAKIIATGEVGYIIDVDNDTVRLDVIESISVNNTTFIPMIKRKTVAVNLTDIMILD